MTILLLCILYCCLIGKYYMYVYLIPFLPPLNNPGQNPGMESVIKVITYSVNVLTSSIKGGPVPPWMVQNPPFPRINEMHAPLWTKNWTITLMTTSNLFHFRFQRLGFLSQVEVLVLPLKRVSPWNTKQRWPYSRNRFLTVPVPVISPKLTSHPSIIMNN